MQRYVRGVAVPLCLHPLHLHTPGSAAAADPAESAYLGVDVRAPLHSVGLVGAVVLSPISAAHAAAD